MFCFANILGSFFNPHESLHEAHMLTVWSGTERLSLKKVSSSANVWHRDSMEHTRIIKWACITFLCWHFLFLVCKVKLTSSFPMQNSYRINQQTAEFLLFNFLWKKIIQKECFIPLSNVYTSHFYYFTLQAFWSQIYTYN